MKRWWRIIFRYTDVEDTVDNEMEDEVFDDDPQLTVDNYNVAHDETELDHVLIAAIPIKERTDV